MNTNNFGHKYYFRMGLLLLILVISGFGSFALVENRNPANLPLIFHIHAVSYICWFALFICQARLINRKNHALHQRLGFLSVIVISSMLITGFIMASRSYSGGESPIPDMTIQQFLSFPMWDLLSIIIFFSIAIINRRKALTHKHAMLMLCIAIMDPALARLAMSIGVPPLVLVFHFSLVFLLVFHDRKVHQQVHWVTWLGLAYLIARVVFIFTLGATDTWASLMDSLFINLPI